MASLTRSQLKTSSNTTYDTNGVGGITAAEVRTFNDDLIDSLITNDLTGGMSVATASLALTASSVSNGVLASLNSFTASATVRLNNLESTSASVNVSISNLNSATSSYAISASVAAVDAAQQQQINSLIAASSSYANSASFAASQLVQDGRLNNLESTSASLLIKTSNLETFSASALVSINALNTNSASVNTSITNLNSATQSLQAQLATIGGQSGSWITESETGSFAITGSNIFRGNQTITGSLLVSGSGDVEFKIAGNNIVNPYFSLSGTNATLNAVDVNMTVNGDVKINNTQATRGIQLIGSDPSIGFRDSSSPNNPYIALVNRNNRLEIIDSTSTVATMNTASFNIPSASFTASLQQGYVWVGDSTGKSVAVATSSFVASIDTASFATTGSNQFNGNQVITGSMTSSLDIRVAGVKMGFGNPLGTASIAIGANTLVNNTGNNNIAIGQSALTSNTTGGGNIAISLDALKSNSTGNQNIAIGEGAFRDNVSGAGNTVMGHNAALNAGNVSLNTIIGKGAAQSIKSNNNTIVGESAGLAITSGSNNTLIGKNSGASIGSGSNNAFLGYQSGDQVSGSNNTLLGGARGVGNWSNVIALSDGAGNIRAKFSGSIWDLTGSVDISGSLTASLAQGFTYVGNASGRTVAVSTSSFASTIETGSFATTASFNQYTASNDQRVSSLEGFSGSALISINNLNAATASYVTETESGSFLITASFDNGTRNLTFTKGNNTTFAVNIPDVSGSAGNFVTTSSFNAYTQSNDQRVSSLETNSASVNISISALNTFTSSANVRLNNLETTTASLNTSVSNLNTATQSLFVSASLAIVTASISNDDITFTKGDGSTFTIQVATGSFALSASYAETASIARNLIVIARNGEASTLPAGTVVHITSAVGDNPIFTTASYDTEVLSSNTFGLLRYSSPSGADVEVVVAGVVTGVDTDPALGYVAGDVLYLSSSGQFTKVQPQAPNQIVALGQVLRAQQNNGSIYVSINNGWELDELHNVQINNPQTGDLIQYESSSYGLWKNKSIQGAGITTTSSFNSYTSSNDQKVNSLIAATGSYAITGSNTFTGQQVIENNPLWILNNNLNLGANTQGSGSAFVGVYSTVDVVTDPFNVFSGYNITSNDGDTIGFAISSYNTANGRPSYCWYGPGTGYNGDNVVFQILSGSSTLSLKRDFSATGSFEVQNFTASLQNGHVFVGNSSGKTTTVATSSFGSTINTGSFATTGSNTFTGNQIIDGGNTLYMLYGGISMASNIEGSGSQYSGVNIFADTAGYPSDIYESFQILDASNANNGILQLAANSYTPQYGGEIVAWIGAGGNNAAGNNTAIIFRTGSALMEVYKPTSFAYDVNITGSLTASLQQGYVWVGASNGKTTTVATSSFGGSSIPAGTVSSSAQILNYNIFATTGSNFFNGNQTITGSTIVSGSFQTSQDITIWNSSGNPTLKIGRGAGNIPSNLAFGESTLINNTSGNDNVVIGSNAMQYSSGSSASSNIAIGNSALQYNQVDQQLAIGKNALKNTTTGNGNTAIGAEALTSNTIGSQNIAIGIGALNKNVDGSRNIAIGPDSGFNIISGTRNTLIGNGAGSGLTGSYNTIIGGYTATGENLSNNIILSDGQGNKELQFSGSTWTTENNFVVSGSLSAANNIKMGRGTDKPTNKVTVGSGGLIVSNSLVTSDSYIFATADTTVGNYSPVVSNITAGSFSLSNGGYGGNISVMYMIVNPY